MAEALARILELNWLKTPEITIRNLSRDNDISLIAFSRDYRVDLHSEFDVSKELSKDIPAGDSKKVRLENYNLADKVLESQIYMLFRAGNVPRKVKPLAGEKLFLYTNLAEKDKWNLSPSKSRDGKIQVNDGPGYALARTSSGANAAGPQIESQLQGLKEEVEKLRVMVKGLDDKVAKLVERLSKSK